MTKGKQLNKALGVFDVFCIASGAMISSGLFVLPALAYSKVGPAVVFSYILAGILVIPAMLAKAELASAMPKAGGTYFFLERSMGAPLGTIGGFASWFSLSLKSAFALLGMGIFATLINPNIPEFQIKAIAVICCLFFMVVNIIGVKETGRLQTVIVMALLALLAIYVVEGFLHIRPERYVPFAPFGAKEIVSTSGLIFVSFGGLTKVCGIAEEVKNPGKKIPQGMFLAFVVVMFFYVTVVFVTVGVLDPEALSGTVAPISLAASTFMGTKGSTLMAFAAILAFISTANAGILTASRDSLAMSRDYLLPKIFQNVTPTSKTPYVSIIATTAFMILVIVALSLENLIKTASTLMILLFLLVNLSLIIMRESRIQNYRPQFHVPLYPWISIMGIFGNAVLLYQMGWIPLMITVVFVTCAFIWYLAYARTKVNRQAALVHVIERITARELLVDATLPDELREIVIERDEIVQDRFDKLASKCQIVDLEKAMAMEDFFKVIAGALSEELDMSQDKIYELLIKREKETSTIIRPGLAIPHIVVDGKAHFTILLARSREGVTFPESDDKVHIAFVLAGTRDERNFHLRALAAIAEIAQAQDFDKAWLGARNIDELRSIVLLAERRRFFSR